MAGALPINTIFNRVVADFAADGHAGVQPDTTFYDLPPVGMGYNGPFEVQFFINKYVNGNKIRYNLAPQTDILVTQVTPEPKAGNLAALIYAHQQ